MTTIKIKDTEYRIKQSIRSVFLWEQISEKPFNPQTTLDNYLYFYCMLLANNEQFMSWDEFLDCLDEDPRILIEISSAIAHQASIDRILDNGAKDDPAGKKKD